VTGRKINKVNVIDLSEKKESEGNGAVKEKALQRKKRKFERKDTGRTIESKRERKQEIIDRKADYNEQDWQKENKNKD
jgi:hypothetical protein